MNLRISSVLFYLYYIFFVKTYDRDIRVYSRYTGYRLLSGLIEEFRCNTTPSVCSLTKCGGQCRCDASCVVINYNAATRVCQLHNKTALYNHDYDDGLPDWVVLEPQASPPEIGEWKMVFRVTAAINISAYDTYTNSSQQDDHLTITSNVSAGCLTVNGSLPCDRHFRSSYLDTWTSRNISQVLVAMYSNGEMISNVTFSATGSDFKTWFDITRVMTSSWDELLTANTTYNFFSIDGDGYRKFFMNTNYGGCGSDRGWMVAVDASAGLGCQWENTMASFPTLLTSNQSTGVKWIRDQTVADVMAIMVKT